MRLWFWSSSVCSRFFWGNVYPYASSIAIFFSSPVFLLFTTFPLLFSPSLRFPFSSWTLFSVHFFFFFPHVSLYTPAFPMGLYARDDAHSRTWASRATPKRPLKRNATKDRVNRFLFAAELATVWWVRMNGSVSVYTACHWMPQDTHTPVEECQRAKFIR